MMQELNKRIFVCVLIDFDLQILDSLLKAFEANAMRVVMSQNNSIWMKKNWNELSIWMKKNWNELTSVTQIGLDFTMLVD